MKQNDLIAALAQLGQLFAALAKDDGYPGSSCGIIESEFNSLKALINKQVHLNGWFTPQAVKQALNAWADQLDADMLRNWTEKYQVSQKPVRVGIIMAGNIPLVGFHDLLCVLLSGHHAVVKMSSDDRSLLPALMEVLQLFYPSLQDHLTISQGKLGPVDAVIATGSNASTKYFEQYFGQLPHVFRKNRSSVAVLDGSETADELRLLGHDLFSYFGLGCRNVSHLLLPPDYNIQVIFEAIYPFHDIVNHHKYANNYDYNRTILMMNQQEFLDNGFVIFKASNELFSPLATVHHSVYHSLDERDRFLSKHADAIQAVVGHSFIPFGAAQCPTLNDYADGVDTMAWLQSLN